MRSAGFVFDAQRIGESEHQPVVLAPAAGVAAVRGRSPLGFGDTGLRGERGDVHALFVLGAAVRRRAQGHQLALFEPLSRWAESWAQNLRRGR